MPAGKASQSNAMLYTVITFVGLFLIATVCAVVFYVKHEDEVALRKTAEATTNKLANQIEQRGLEKIVGKAVKGKSYLGTMNEYLDTMISRITGKVADTTAEAKVNEVALKINELNESLAQDASGNYGPEGVDLIQTITQLKTDLVATRGKADDMEDQLAQIQSDFEAAIKEYQIIEDELIADKDRYQKLSDEIQASYDQLKADMQSSADAQVQLVRDELEKTEENRKNISVELMDAQENLARINSDLQAALRKLEDIKPRPDIEVEAFAQDAKVVSVDLQTKIVYLNVGSDDHVYRGLTFSVYDKSAPIPEDGKGKAEIEVFQVRKTVSAAKINTSSKKSQIVAEDMAVNLIWNKDTSNTFVIIGEYDFNGDGTIDRDGREKIAQLIERWGGTIVDKVDIDTDFVVMGTEPRDPVKPTPDQIDIDPSVEQRYLAQLQVWQSYNRVLEDAGTLSVPKFSYKRFLNLIGYESNAQKSSPF